MTLLRPVSVGTWSTHSRVFSGEELTERLKLHRVESMLEMADARRYRFWGDLTEGLRKGKPQNEIKRRQLPRGSFAGGRRRHHEAGDPRRRTLIVYVSIIDDETEVSPPVGPDSMVIGY